MIEYIRKHKRGEAVFRVLEVDNVNRIIDVLVNIRGDGCTIEKPTNAEGRNWKIIFDGKQSDTPREGGNEDPEDPKPLDYLIRFVSDVPRESQYGDWAAQTDFNAVANASQEWMRDTVLPLGYCYITFTPAGASVTTSARADGIASGFSLKAQRKNGVRLYRLAHANHHAAMMMQGDDNSIQVDVKNYPAAPAYILRQWNTDKNYITIPESAFGRDDSGYDFLTYDTYLPSGQRRIDHPAEIKFAAMNKSFFQDIVFEVTEIVKQVIDDYLCDIVFQHILTWLDEYHAMCKNYNQDGLPYVAVPGGRHGGWIHLSDVEGLADFDDLQDLLAEVRTWHGKVTALDVAGLTRTADDLLSIIDGVEDDLTDYADALSLHVNDLDAVITSLNQVSSELGRLESVADSQEARVEALKAH